MTKVWPFPHVNQNQNSYPITNFVPSPPCIDGTSRKSHFHEIFIPFFLNFNSKCFFLLIMFYAIYSGKFFLSSIGATNIYINLEILEVAEIIENCIFLKFIITKKKKNLINNIYYLTKCHLHNFLLKKKKNQW